MTTSKTTDGVQLRIDRRRQLVTGGAGHLIEYFDWSAYSFLAIYFAHQFFPGDESSLVPLLSTFAVFAVGFLARPVGGIVLGRIADRRGRKTALSLSVAMMGIGSLIIGVAPNYDHVGVVAPIILVIARLVQGFSTGGELATASAFLMESAPDNRRGTFTSSVNVTSSAGKVICLAVITALVQLVGAENMSDWAWRVPFLIGAAGAVAAWWIRQRAQETLTAPTPAKTKKSSSTEHPGFRSLFTDHRGAFWRAFGVATITSAMFYTWGTFVPTWAAVTTGLDKESAVLISTVAFVFYGLIQVPLGRLSDRIGRRPMLFTFAIGNIVLTVPLFLLISSNVLQTLVVQCLGLALTASLMSISGAMLGEMFPSRVRVLATGTAISFATAIFGGTIPLIGTGLHNAGTTGLFPLYLVALNVIGLIGLWRIVETAHRPLPS
ncbi:MFS transporter [Rhodococcoides fascians]|uniref:MFS transporter n=1 Tax=Rhodococcoides fascians TaxID=1828 RepID=UPI00050CCD29|nr:MFS transporter [Rhodococcus fascians]